MSRVIGIDLSKKSTGVSIVDVKNNSLKIVDNFSIKTKKEKEFNKFYFYAKDLLIDRLREIFESQNCQFFVAFEFPIFSDYTSELQFYLTQELLNLCYSKNINVVGYSPHFLKKFIKGFVSDGKKYRPHLHKEDIRDIYERYTFPLNRGVLSESELILDDDSMDGLFLGVLGSSLQNYLEYDKSSIANEMTMQNILNHKFDSLLLINSNYYRDRYLDNIKSLEFLNFRFHPGSKKFKDQFKSLIKDSIVNNHLTLRSKMFFPFHMLSVLSAKMRVFKLKRPDEFYTFWVKYLGTRRSFLESYLPMDKNFTILCNKNGSYFLYKI